MGSIQWTDKTPITAVSLKLRDDLFTVAQLMENPYMRFFDIRNDKDEWHGIDLNNETKLFTSPVGQAVITQLVLRKLTDQEAKPSDEPLERFWIKPHLNFDGEYPFKGGRLIDMSEVRDSLEAPTVKEYLDPDEDKETILGCETTGTYGTENLLPRLLSYFDSGFDHDSHKKKIFPELFS